MKQVMTVIILCSLVVPAFLLGGSDAWSGCTVDQRIELGNQGYGKDEVERACGDSGDDFWGTLSRGLATGLANGLTNSLNKALGGSETNYNTDAPSATNGATMCSTNYGTCPLSGGPVNYACYCRGWNGYTFTGISK
jgi:hypothetical protein